MDGYLLSTVYLTGLMISFEKDTCKIRKLNSNFKF